MQRIPEPELMDSAAQARAYAEADFENSNQMFCDLFMQAFPQRPERAQLIDLGCGPADICVRMATALPGWRLTGVDAGPNMLLHASRAVVAAGLTERVSLRQAYLPDPGLPQQAFEAVISNSLLHHLPDPDTLWHSIRQIARPGAMIMIMDLRRPQSTDAAALLVDQWAAGAPEVLREDFYNSLLAAYTVEEITTQIAQAGLSILDISEPSDRHWLVTGRMPD